jgi:hypothetical protein
MSVPSHADVIVLARRPGPSVLPGDLALERRRVRPPGPWEVVVQNVVTSVDPYQLRMLRGSPDVAPVDVGDPVPANSVGIVVQSADPRVPPGTQVATYTGWQAYATTTIGPTEVADAKLGSPVDWLSVLGTVGITAFVGVHDVGHLQPGHTMLISAATGGVGGVAVQLAKAAGARVIAIAGGRQRTDHAAGVLGADVALDHRDPAFPDQLGQAAGDGIDVYFDNVGGRQLTLAMSVLKNFAASCCAERSAVTPARTIRPATGPRRPARSARPAAAARRIPAPGPRPDRAIARRPPRTAPTVPRPRRPAG